MMGVCQEEKLVHVATVGRPHGVRGLVHLFALTESPSTLEQLSPLQDEAGAKWYVRWVRESVASLEHTETGLITSREAASLIVHTKLYALRAQFPQAEDDEFYHTDLIGQNAILAGGTALGTVATVHDYGGGVSLEIKGENQSWIVPFTKACVPKIDLASGVIEIVLPEEVEVEGDLSGGGNVVVRQ